MFVWTVRGVQVVHRHWPLWTWPQMYPIRDAWDWTDGLPPQPDPPDHHPWPFWRQSGLAVPDGSCLGMVPPYGSTQSSRCFRLAGRTFEEPWHQWGQSPDPGVELRNRSRSGCVSVMVFWFPEVVSIDSEKEAGLGSSCQDVPLRRIWCPFSSLLRKRVYTPWSMIGRKWRERVSDATRKWRGGWVSSPPVLGLKTTVQSSSGNGAMPS